jgi:hypothetical protein
MPTNIGMPELIILFKGLGVSAVARGERGAAALIVIDDTETEERCLKLETTEDFTSEEQAKYTTENVQIIKDALAGVPQELYIFNMKSESVIADILLNVGGKVPSNCWIGLVSSVTADHTEISAWTKAKNLTGKRFKSFVYNATSTDDKHVVNYTNANVKFADDRGTQEGWKAIGYLVGLLAGLSLNLSVIAKELDVLESVEEPEDLDTAISNGEFVLFNDEGVVKVARGVNSLVTIGQDVTEDMCQINVVEKMDQIYTDIQTAWKNNYKGKYPNLLDNQILLISAIDAYYQGLESTYLLDKNYDNTTEVDIEAQKLANYSKYGEETVKAWDDMEAIQMTVGTKVFFKSNVKILGIMEDMYLNIYM